jgi:monothiol glutaredoxin
MDLDAQTREKIADLISQNDVLLFMKGSRETPQCGFSATCVRILDGLIPDYQTLDVLQNPDLREGIKVFSSWPTVPQLYVKGDFVGGCDIIQELFASGELHQTLGVSHEQAAAPSIDVTEKAAAALQQAIAQQAGGGRELRLGIDARLRTSLSLAPRAAGDLEIECGGVRLLLDPRSAQRANGARIDVVDTDRGPGFQIDVPGATS